MAELMLRIARPLIWHNRTEVWPKKINGATCFFLKFDTKIVGVTAAHVYKIYLSENIENCTSCQISSHLPFVLKDLIIDICFERDIMTFSVPSGYEDGVGFISVDCRGNWPPPDIKIDDRLMLCGYPELSRVVDFQGSADFGGYGSVTVVDDFDDRSIHLSYDPRRVNPAAWAPSVPSLGLNMSGCSGGPALMLRVKSGLVRWFAVGLIERGPAGHRSGLLADLDLIRLARLHAILPDGTIRR
jgi:hypothetical protein